MAGAAIRQFLSPIIAIAELLAVRIGPGGEIGAVASDVEAIEGNEVELDRAPDKTSVEDELKSALVSG
jgi:hypothetical protein